MTWLAVLVLTVTLGGGFGEAAAEATLNNDGTIDVRLQVEVPADTVVAHLVDPGGDQQTVALAPRRDGTFEGVATVEPTNRVVVFEAMVAGRSVTSRPVTLLELGVPALTLGIEGPNLLEGSEPERDVVLGLDRAQATWLAVALAAAALALLAWWALPERAAIDPSSAPGTEPPAEADETVLDA